MTGLPMPVPPSAIPSELDQARNHIKGLQAQLDACKQMFNDGSNLILQLRTDMNLKFQHINEQNQMISQKDADIERMQNEIKTLTAKILELNPPPSGKPELTPVKK
jgi:uncharacterized coiled-coil protein SlyX